MAINFTKWTLLFLGLSTFSANYAAEVDTFTKLHLPLQDSLETINAKTNEYLAIAIEEANEEEHGCDEKVLYKKMRQYFSNQHRGDLGKYIVEANDFDKHPMTIEESIYGDFTWYQSIIQGLYGRIFKDPTAATINVNGVLLGTDKFEHFMGSGFRYFKTYHLKGKKIEKALRIGHRAETGAMGAITTGVKAYGDLSANFNGMRFWNHVLQKRKDILGENIGPYVVCQSSRFEMVKEISWASYVDDSYDETINCSAFTWPKMLDSVQDRLKKLEDRHGGSYSCPLDRSRLEKVKERYGDIAPHIINDIGHYSIRGGSKK